MAASYLDEIPIGLWLGVWAVVYAGDYYLTILGARMFRAGAHRYFDLRGSYELTPEFQRDIDALRLVSPRFILRLVISCAVIYALWFLETHLLPAQNYVQFLLGGLLLREAAVYLRHARILNLFRMANRAKDLEGRISYPRWLTLKNSAVELWSFSVLYALLAVLLRSVFLAGGALTCAITGWQHWRMGSAFEKGLQTGRLESVGEESEKSSSDSEAS